LNLLTERASRIFAGTVLCAALIGCAPGNHFETAKQLRRNEGQARILVMPADIQLSELTAGGVEEPKADWTDAARGYLATALREEHAAGNNVLVDYDEGRAPVEKRDDLHQLYKLYATTGQAIFVHQYGGPLHLPTKGNQFEWSIGPSIHGLHDEYGADYALLTYVRDSYASPGRQAMMAASVVIAALVGVTPVVQGGRTVAFTSLVDLQTGDIVWFNRVVKGTGDLRTADGAHDAAKELLAGIPK
jgi:hypothetical protein